MEWILALSYLTDVVVCVVWRESYSQKSGRGRIWMKMPWKTSQKMMKTRKRVLKICRKLKKDKMLMKKKFLV